MRIQNAYFCVHILLLCILLSQYAISEAWIFGIARQIEYILVALRILLESYVFE